MHANNVNAHRLEHAEIVATLTTAARAAGKLQLEQHQTDLAVDQFLAHDIKLEADRLSEEVIINAIKSFDPDASFVTEESGECAGSGNYLWIIDPLDGTMNYFQKQYHYCTCIACYRRPEKTDRSKDDKTNPLSKFGTPVAGVVYAAAYDEMYTAVIGEYSTCNHRRIQPQSVNNLRDAIIATSFGSKPEVMQRMTKLITERLLPSSRKLRIQGSCGLDLCGVASGKLSALYQEDVRVWDFAAARIILEKSGAKFEATEFAPGRWNVLAATTGIFSQLQEIIHTI